MTKKKIYRNILSIDSSLEFNLITILHNNIFKYKINICHKNHESNILTMIKSLLSENFINIKDFTVISFVSGPGSFTGIRLSASIAQGLSILNNINLIGISKLKILAEQAWRLYKIKKIIVCNIANKTQFYWAKYHRNQNFWFGKEMLVNKKQALKKIYSLQEIWYMIGTGSMYFKNIKSRFLYFIDIQEPYAQDIITLTQIEANKKNFLPLEHIQLNYLNNPIY